jgi:2-keto-4-pentenoate hydratase/2-oxohepta-3-ene-1,7-dioic acid hydratase in catechol pathway
VKLATFRAPGRQQPLAGEVLDERVVAFEGGVGVIDVLAGAAPSRGSDSWELSEVTLLAPVPRPGTIYAIGRNYAAHAAEMGNQPPEQPIVFVKVAGSVAPPGGPIRCPEVVRRLDYEGELTIVMGAGQGCGHLLPVRPLGHHRRRGPRSPGARFAHLGQR